MATRRRDFLAVVGGAVGAAAALAPALAGEAQRAQDPPSARDMEGWLLSTGRGRLDPRLLEIVQKQIKRT